MQPHPSSTPPLRRLLISAALALALLLGLLPPVSIAPTSAVAQGLLPPTSPQAPSTCGFNNGPDIGGTVFRDFDSDGVRDANEPGVENVTVTIYGPDGNSLTTDTDEDGIYVFFGVFGIVGSVRVEFSGLPSYMAPGVHGDDSGTTVQFHTATTCGADLAVQNPADYCEQNPRLSLACYEDGRATSSNPGIVSFSYDVSGIPAVYGGPAESPRSDAEIQEVGSVWGVAYQRETSYLFNSTFLKRHVGLGPRGEDGIYILDYSGGTASVVGGFDLQGITPANSGDAASGGLAIDLGAVTRSTDANSDNYLPDTAGTAGRDLDAFDKVAKTSLGDIDLTEDEQTLWAVNLNQAALISIDVSSVTPSTNVPAPPSGAVNQYLLSQLAGVPACSDGTFRPWALTFADGVGYLGGVCDAATGSVAELDAHVLSFDPANIAAGFATELTFDLDYAREPLDGGDPVKNRAEWNPWASSWPLEASNTSNYPQPILSNIEFMEDGAMVIALMDRWGHQTGNENYRAIPGDDNNTFYSGLAGGDLVKACNINGAFVIEGDTGCAVNDPGSNITVNDQQRSDDGVSGNGEFFHADLYFYDGVARGDENPFQFRHYEISTGGAAVLPGSNEVVGTVWDPIEADNSPGADSGLKIFTQGIKYYNSSSGGRSDDYLIAENIQGKANGLGDMALLCAPAPLEIGNYVWSDTDGDGVQDPDEPGIDGVTVTLHDMDDGGAQVGTATTANGGQYYFGGVNDTNMTSGSLLTNRNYEVRISLSDAALPVNSVTTQNANGLATNDNKTDLADSDAVESNGNAVIAFTTGGPGANNHTLDMGFAEVDPVSIGSYVWEDTNDNGTQDDGEPPIQGALVELLVDDGTGAFIPATDFGGTAVPSQTTVADGLYFFDNLPEGDYRVRVTPPAGFVPSSVQTTADNNDGETDSNIASEPVAGTYESGTFTLTAGGEPTETGNEAGDNQDNAAETDGNMTVDFGFVPIYDFGDLPDSYGTTLASDGARHQINASIQLGPNIDDEEDGQPSANADGDDATGDPDDEDGIAFGAPILAGTIVPVTVTASLADGTNGFVSLWIDLNGNGMFDAGEDLLNGAAVANGENGFNLTIPADTAVADVLYVRARLASDASEIASPTGEASAGEVEDYVLMSLGNTVWLDDGTPGDDADAAVANNRILDGNEAGVPGVTVELYALGDVPGTDEPLATTETNENGNYLFTGLQPGDYVVHVPAENFAQNEALAGYLSSSGVEEDINLNADQDANENGIDPASLPAYLTDGVSSGAVNLALGAEPTADGNGPNSNLTVDFSFVPQYDFGDLPSANGYPTQLGDASGDGANHRIIPGVYLGAGVDSEADGQPNVNANGDDAGAGDSYQTITDDEDGVAFGAIAAGRPFTLTVTASTAGYLNQWIDFNGNGVLEPGELLGGGDVELVAGENVLSFTAPADVTTNALYSRARFTLNPGVATLPTGAAPSGEVEDYVLMSLGDTIFIDDGDGAARDNGIFDGDNNGEQNEVPVEGVLVELYAADATPGVDTPLGSTRTDENGNYFFTGLQPGDYVVHVAAENFAQGEPLVGHVSSTGAGDPNAPVNEDADENGIDDDSPGTNGISSGPVTLALGEEPNGNGYSDLNVDFGFVPQYDYGDLPDAGEGQGTGDYETLVANGPPRHLIVDGVFLGASVDAEDDGQPSVLANGDDGAPVDAADDEDGVVFLTPMIPGETARIQVTASVPGYLSGWMDWNEDGRLGPEDRVLNDVLLAAGSQELTFTVPADADPAALYSRFRFALEPGQANQSVGTAPSGEVEDYVLMSLGDTIWFDDGTGGGVADNGILDGGETGVPGVLVELLDEDGNVLGTTTTANNGSYFFYGLVPENYTVRVAASNFAPDGALAGYRSSTGDEGDPNVNADQDAGENGVDPANLAAYVSDGVSSGLVEMTLGEEPAANGLSNPTVDFGFVPVFDFGDLPSENGYPTTLADDANGGARHQIVSGIYLGAGVDAETDGQPTVNADGDDVADGDGINDVPGDADGDEDGVLFLTPLTPGTTAQIQVTASTDGLLNAWFDFNNNGTFDEGEKPFSDTPLTAGVNTLDVVVPAGDEPAALYSRFRFGTVEGEATTPTGAASDGEVEDYVLLSLGNTVFLDNGANSNNGILDGDEAGVRGVVVELLDAVGTVIATRTTGPNGNYLFSGLTPGDYSVRLAASNFAPDGPLAGLRSSTGAGDPNADADQDVDENGIDADDPATTGITSAPVTLTIGGEPTAEDGNPHSNLTVDFGLVGFDLALRKTVAGIDTGDVIVGSQVTYAIEVINQGDVAATDVLVVDYVPAGMTFDPALNAGWDGTDPINPTITIAGPITRGSPATANIVLTVNPGTETQTLANFAEIADDNQPPGTDVDSTPDSTNDEEPVKDDVVDEDAKGNPDGDPGDPNDPSDDILPDDEDDHDVATVAVAIFDLALQKVVAQPLASPLVPGTSTVTFELRLTNQGGFTAAAGTVQLVDYVQPGFTFDPANNDDGDDDDASGWAGDAANPTLIINEAIGPGQSVTRTITLSLDAGTEGQDLTNVAEIADDGEPVDQDSTPDSNNDDEPVKDDITDEDALVNPGVDDEDDHDVASLSIEPLSLGNYVWFDANGNGQQEPSEMPLAGATVELFQGDGATPAVDVNGDPIAATVTITDGFYNFGNLPAGDFVVRVTPPAGHVSTIGGADPDDDPSNTDSNGLPVDGQPYVQSPAVTLAAGAEPTVDDETDQADPFETPDSNSNLTVDFGFFRPVSLGSVVWEDRNVDGVLDDDEPRIPGATVTLFQGDGVTPAQDVNGADVPPVQTGPDGTYNFSNLPPGDYVVQVATPPGYAPTGTPDDPDADDNPSNTDSNGVPNDDGSLVQSPPVTLISGAEPTTEGETDPSGTPDADGNLTLDFGFFQPVSVGNYVWFDLNVNGLQDDNLPLAGALVTLLDGEGNSVEDIDGNPVAPITTAADGFYNFSNLLPGDYQVQVQPPANYVPTRTSADADPDSNPANDDSNGLPTGSGAVRSPIFTLEAGTEPTVDDESDQTDPSGTADANSNLTIDFGFFQTVSLGNYVWLDQNLDGQQGADEPALEGAIVELFDSNGDPVTDAEGEPVGPVETGPEGFYSFSNLVPGDYIVQVTPPGGYVPTIGGADADDDPSNTDSNGVPVPNAIGTTNAVRSPVVTLVPGTEPTVDDESDGGDPSETPDANSNLTLDFGFFETVSLGDFVWLDADADGQQDADEPGLPGATVTLLDGDGNPVTDANGNPVAPVTTGDDGAYNFPNLRPGDYQVQVTPPADYIPSPTDADPDPDGNPSNTDSNGVPTDDGNVVRSPVLTLTPGDEPTDADGDDPSGTPDANANGTVDFGFYQLVSLGNLVWRDDNNSGTVDEGEPGIEGVQVVLWEVDVNGSLVTPVFTTTTDVNGGYLFENLVPGDYLVQIPPGNFAEGGPLDGQVNTVGNGVTAPDPDDDVDNDDNGDPAAGLGILSQPVTLTSGGEPVNDGDDDPNSNLTVDFGFFRTMSLGNRVWLDTGAGEGQRNNGVIDEGENGIEGVVVTLLDAAGEPLLNGAGQPITTTTDAGGYYLFENLTPGDYRVRIDAENFQPGGPLAELRSSTPTAADPNNDVDSDDNGIDVPDPAETGITSGILTLSYGEEMMGETDLGLLASGDAEDSDSSLTVDFGFFQEIPKSLALRSLSATLRDGALTVRWQSSLETDTFGFHVHAGGERSFASASRLTSQLVTARGAESVYETTLALDSALLDGPLYVWLVEVELDGSENRYGPVRVLSPSLFLPLVRN